MGQSVKLTTDLHPVPRLSVGRVMPPQPRTLLWREALISTRTTLPLPLTLQSLINYHVTFLNNVTHYEITLQISRIAVLYSKA
jgi:hypothetical protein